MKWLKQFLKINVEFLPSIAYLEGEYGYDDIYLVFQQFLVRMVSKKSLNLELTDDEKAALDKSAESVKNVMAILDNRL